MRQLVNNELKKGDAIGTARIAGVMAAKRTAELIPLCHNIDLTDVQLEICLNEVARRIGMQALQCFRRRTRF